MPRHTGPAGASPARPHLFGVRLANASVRTSCELAPSTRLAPSTHPETGWGSQSVSGPLGAAAGPESPLHQLSLGLICAPKNKGIQEKRHRRVAEGLAPGEDALMANTGLSPPSAGPTAPLSPAPVSPHRLYPWDFDPLVKFVLNRPRS